MNVASLFADRRTQKTFHFFEHPAVATAFFLALIVLATFLASCSTLGIPNADTFNKKLAVAYTSVNTARDLTTDLLKAGKLSVTDAKATRDKLNDASAAIDAAKASYPTDPTLGENKLATALQVVNALQTFLQSKQASP